MNRKKILTAVLTMALCAGMTAPVYAVTNPFAAMEAQSRQAVEAAVKAGTVPPGTTIYDCMYGADKNSVTIVIQYKDKNGDWIDVIMQEKVDNNPANTAGSANRLTEKQLDEYALEVYRLVNKERQKAGLDEVVWDDDCAACAQIRAEELEKKYSHMLSLIAFSLSFSLTLPLKIVFRNHCAAMGDRKTATFFIISDTDSTYNFIVAGTVFTSSGLFGSFFAMRFLPPFDFWHEKRA